MMAKFGKEFRYRNYLSSMIITDLSGKLCLNKCPQGSYLFNYRTANNLKNRFYTVLRNLIKLLFKKKGNDCPKLPG